VTLKLKASCSPESFKILKETVIQFTGAYNRATKQGYDFKTTNYCAIHHMRYKEERKNTDLPSQLVCGMISRATESLISVKKLQKEYDEKVRWKPKKYKPKTFRCPHSDKQSVRYDGKRASTVNLDEGWATLTSVNGRQEVRFTVSPNFNKYTDVLPRINSGGSPCQAAFSRPT